MKMLVIVPAFNEAEVIESVIGEIRGGVPQADILVVNDGSTDETSQKAKDQGVWVLDLPFNMGIGSTFQAGLIFAKRHGYDYAAQVDGDGQHDPRDLARLVLTLDKTKADMIVGSRFLGEGDFSSTMPRRQGIRFFSWLLNLLFRTRVTDPTSGFRVMNQRAIELFSEEYPSDYPEPEALAMAYRSGMKVMEIPCTMQARRGGVSSINFARACYYMVKVTLAILMTLVRPRKKVLV